MYEHYLYFSGNKLKLDKNKKYIIGRAESCNIRLADFSVSRLHAVIEWDNNSFVITDMGSTNGILKNGRVIKQDRLKDDDKFRIGTCWFKYQTVAAVSVPNIVHNDTIQIDRRVNEILKQVNDPKIIDKIMELKHYINLQNEKLTAMAYNDILTGLYNRRYFDKRLDEEIERAGRYGRDLCLIMADIDHFKMFNDNYGHQKGDEVLTTVGTVITRHIRKNDIAARYGGEEIAIILPETNIENSRILAEKIREKIHANTEMILDIDITISIGIASLSFGQDKASLIEAADKALYAAKENGRNRVEIYDSCQDEKNSYQVISYK